MITTDRLLLRAPRPDDLLALHAVFSDPRAMVYWSHAAHDTPARTQDTLDGMIRSYQETGLEYVIEHDGAVIGKAGLWRLGEIGYILHPDHWGKGLASEALAAILPAAWARHEELAEITAEIDPENTASARLLTRFGFRLTHSARSTIQINGKWCDSAYFALKRPAAHSP
ncbi:GNAT family N-acetyltransferase [Aliiroseovarius marinus]|uniref:GNAT family N-acetyltransferase n=1 Tax=Aliiroseovarius marinus TaxID=2500159 RepID=UPI003D7DBD17